MVREEEPPRPSTKLSTADALPTLVGEPRHRAGAAERAASRRTRLDRDEGAGEGPRPALRDGQRVRGRRAAVPGGMSRCWPHPPSRAYRLRKFVAEAPRPGDRREPGGPGPAGRHRGNHLGAGPGRPRSDRRGPTRQGTRCGVGKADEALKKEAERVERDAAVKVADARADDLKYRLGVSDMVLARATYDNGDVVLAAERLDHVPPGRRGWEWRHLKQKTRGGLFTLYGHTQSVCSAVVQPRRLAHPHRQSGPGGEGVGRATGAALLELRGHMAAVTSASFSPDGSRDPHR